MLLTFINILLALPLQPSENSSFIINGSVCAFRDEDRIFGFCNYLVTLPKSFFENARTSIKYPVTFKLPDEMVYCERLSVESLERVLEQLDPLIMTLSNKYADNYFFIVFENLNKEYEKANSLRQSEILEEAGYIFKYIEKKLRELSKQLIASDDRLILLKRVFDIKATGGYVTNSLIPLRERIMDIADTIFECIGMALLRALSILEIETAIFKFVSDLKSLEMSYDLEVKLMKFYYTVIIPECNLFTRIGIPVRCPDILFDDSKLTLSENKKADIDPENKNKPVAEPSPETSKSMETVKSEKVPSETKKTANKKEKKSEKAGKKKKSRNEALIFNAIAVAVEMAEFEAISEMLSCEFFEDQNPSKSKQEDSSNQPPYHSFKKIFKFDNITIE